MQDRHLYQLSAHRSCILHHAPDLVLSCVGPAANPHIHECRSDDPDTAGALVSAMYRFPFPGLCRASPRRPRTRQARRGRHRPVPSSEDQPLQTGHPPRQLGVLHLKLGDPAVRLASMRDPGMFSGLQRDAQAPWHGANDLESAW